MRGTLHGILPQWQYAEYLRNSAAQMSEVKKLISASELAKYQAFKNRPSAATLRDPDALMAESLQRNLAAKELIKAMVLQKAGVTTSLGYNFYDLRGPVRLAYPVNVPFRNSLARVGRINDGFGTAAHWKATRNPGTVYAGVAEGQRNQIATPDSNDYAATYKEIGVERGATFSSQFAGEGFADNVALEHIRGLHELWLQEEGLMLFGNSGTATGNNGFALGTAPTPTTALVNTHSVGANGNLGTPGLADLPYTTQLTTSNYVSVAVVILTALGNPNNSQYGYGLFPTIASGLTPSYVRTNQDGSQVTINGGMSAISAISSTPLQCTTGNLTVKASIPAASLPVKGAAAYAWFVDVESSNTGSLANAKLAGITTTPYCYVSGTATGTQTGAATGLSADHSFNTTDFDGLLTYAASTAGAYWIDAQGASMTSQKNGRVTELEAALAYLWTNFQAGVDTIWCSADAAISLDQAIRYSGTVPTAYRFDYARDAQNNILGGFVVSAYQSRYSMNSTGANAIPIKIHPMLPPGTIYLDIFTNPYPHSESPYVRSMLVQRDYYSIEWPLVSRQWTFGTYTHEVLAHEYPWLSAVLTGFGPFNASQ